MQKIVRINNSCNNKHQNLKEILDKKNSLIFECRSYLERSLHYHTCCIVNTLASILKNGGVTLFFGLTNIFIDFL